MLLRNTRTADHEDFMDKQAAIELLMSAIPDTGAVSWESVHNTLQATPEGRAAIQYFHAARRDRNVLWSAVSRSPWTRRPNTNTRASTKSRSSFSQTASRRKAGV
jgi:hypothetical protein